VCEVEAKSCGAGARLDVRRRVHARAAAVVDVAEMIGVEQRTRHRRRPVHVHGGCVAYDTIRYDTRCYFNVRSKADISRLNLPHRNDN